MSYHPGERPSDPEGDRAVRLQKESPGYRVPDPKGDASDLTRWETGFYPGANDKGPCVVLCLSSPRWPYDISDIPGGCPAEAHVVVHRVGQIDAWSSATPRRDNGQFVVALPWEVEPRLAWPMRTGRYTATWHLGEVRHRSTFAIDRDGIPTSRAATRLARTALSPIRHKRGGT